MNNVNLEMNGKRLLEDLRNAWMIKMLLNMIKNITKKHI